MTDPSWRLMLLGRIDLTGDDADAAERVLVQPKHVALLSYLVTEDALHRGGNHATASVSYQRRDDLAALFWPELDQAHARASLRRVVHQVRGALGAEVLLSRGDEELAVNAALLRADVAEFTSAIAAGRLAAALDLWRGEMMPGFHLSGCAELMRRLDDQRALLREEAGGAAWALAEKCEEDDEPTLAAQWARRVPKFAPDDERVLRRALSMLARLGDRAGALRVYDDFARRLRNEFDAEPSLETQTLLKTIRS